MNKGTSILVAVLSVICVAAGTASVFQWVRGADLARQLRGSESRVQVVEQEHQNTVLRLGQLEQQLARSLTASESLRAKVTQGESEKAMLRAELEQFRHPDPGERSCHDSDGELGEDSIYVRGYIKTESGGKKTDGCQSERLLEHKCTENPPGSGRSIPDYELVACPEGSRCVSGECLRPSEGSQPYSVTPPKTES